MFQPTLFTSRVCCLCFAHLDRDVVQLIGILLRHVRRRHAKLQDRMAVHSFDWAGGLHVHCLPPHSSSADDQVQAQEILSHQSVILAWRFSVFTAEGL